MTHPLYTLHLITDQVESIKIDLTDKNDKTAEILKTIKQIQKNIIELRENYNSEKSKLENEQNHYFDEVIFEFAPDNKFEDGIYRRMRGIQVDMLDLSNWIHAERRIADKNDEFHHSRITLIDYDGNDLPDSEKIDEDSED
jgi:Mg2+ and Co2+ transporter CorA